LFYVVFWLFGATHEDGKQTTTGGCVSLTGPRQANKARHKLVDMSIPFGMVIKIWKERKVSSGLAHAASMLAYGATILSYTPARFFGRRDFFAAPRPCRVYPQGYSRFL
jgi:hypothetical protein